MSQDIPRLFPFLLLGILGLGIAGSPAAAGSVDLQWDPVPGASGYRVYHGTEPGAYTRVLDVGARSSATVRDLTDCTTWYFVVKAYNRAGESREFSNEVSGWPRPEITSASPSARLQGSQFTLEIDGANFRTGASVKIENPNVFFDAVTTVSCKRIELAATVEPTAKGVRPAEIGRYPLTIVNPDGVFGRSTAVFEIGVNPARFDLDRRPGPTEGRLDGMDTIWLSRLFAGREGTADYYPDADFNGDGWIDGVDLAYLVSHLGTCWDGSGWSVSACPEE